MEAKAIFKSVMHSFEFLGITFGLPSIRQRGTQSERLTRTDPSVVLGASPYPFLDEYPC